MYSTTSTDKASSSIGGERKAKQDIKYNSAEFQETDHLKDCVCTSLVPETIMVDFIAQRLRWPRRTMPTGFSILIALHESFYLCKAYHYKMTLYQIWLCGNLVEYSLMLETLCEGKCRQKWEFIALKRIIVKKGKRLSWWEIDLSNRVQVLDEVVCVTPLEKSWILLIFPKLWVNRREDWTL